jgi:Methyltransferase domain
MADTKMETDTTCTSTVKAAIEGFIIRKKKIKGGDWIVVTIRTQDGIQTANKQDDVNILMSEKMRHQPQQLAKFYNVHIHKSIILEENIIDDASGRKSSEFAINCAKKATRDRAICNTNECVLEINCNETCERFESPKSSSTDMIPSCCLYLQSIVRVRGYILVNEEDQEHRHQDTSEIQQRKRVGDYNAITCEQVDPKTTGIDPIAKVYAEYIELLQCAPDPFAVRFIVEHQLFSKELSLRTSKPLVSSQIDDNPVQQQQQQHKVQHADLCWLKAIFPKSCSMYQDELQLQSKVINDKKNKKTKDTNATTETTSSNHTVRNKFALHHDAANNEREYVETLQVYERLYQFLYNNMVSIEPSRVRQQRLLIAKIVRGIQNLPYCHDGSKKRQQQFHPPNLQQPNLYKTNMNTNNSISITCDDTSNDCDEKYPSVHDQHHKNMPRNGQPRVRLPRLKPKDLQQFERLEGIVGTLVSKSGIRFCLAATDPSETNEEMSSSTNQTDGRKHKNIEDNSQLSMNKKHDAHIELLQQDTTPTDSEKSGRALHNGLNIPGIESQNICKSSSIKWHTEGNNEDFFLNDNYPIMSTRGTLSRRQYLLDKKHPQIEWIIRRLKSLPPPIPAPTTCPKIINTPAQRQKHDPPFVANDSNHHCQMNQQQPNHILDVGGGRGDLAVALQLEFPMIHVTIVDSNQQSLDAALLYAKKMKCNLKHLHFICIDFFDYVFDERETCANTITDCTVVEDQQQQVPATIPPIDFVVALHACGDLSDLALFYAQQRLQCPFIICPCCYTKQYISQRSSQAELSTTSSTSVCSYMVKNDGVDNPSTKVSFSAPWRRRLECMCVGPDYERNLLNKVTFLDKTSKVRINEVLEQPQNEDHSIHSTSSTTQVVEEKLLHNQEVSVTKEWCSTKHQIFPQVLLGKLAELNERPSICQRAMTIINSLRLYCVILPDTVNGTAFNCNSFVPSHYRGAGLQMPTSSKRVKYDVSLEEYDSALSRRNQVLVGTPCFV